MAAPKPPTPEETALAEAENLLGLWLRTRQFFAKANTEDPITREEEQQFLEMKSEVTKVQRTVAPKIPADAGFGSEKMIELLRQSISIGHLRGLPRADRMGIMAQWHSVFIYMCRAVGALKFIAEGWQPRAKQKDGGANISDLKKAAAKKGDKEPSVLASPKTYIALILIAAAAFFVYRQFNR
jgi:hypothetical protein